MSGAVLYVHLHALSQGLLQLPLGLPVSHAHAGAAGFVSTLAGGHLLPERVVVVVIVVAFLSTLGRLAVALVGFFIYFLGGGGGGGSGGFCPPVACWMGVLREDSVVDFVLRTSLTEIHSWNREKRGKTFTADTDGRSRFFKDNATDR